MLLTKFPKYLAEAVGTFILVFAGCAAVVVNEITAGRISTVGIGLVFGLVVMAMIYTIGHISGAHMNPAVTIGFVAAGRLAPKEAPLYIAAQLAGAMAASLFLRLMFLGTETSLGATLPAGPWQQSFALEYALTAILMFVIMGVATDHRAEGTMAGVAIGATIGLEAILGGPISGASMNPARSFGPALVSGNFSFHWIYWIAPVLGSLTGAGLYRLIACPSQTNLQKSGCC